MNDDVNQYEFKRPNRFLVHFPEVFNVDEYMFTSITRPTLTNWKWENILIRFIDPVIPSTTEKLYSIYDILKDKKEKPLFTFSIVSLDPTGIEIEEWIIEVEDIIGINFGISDYANDGIQILQMEIKPLNCYLKH